MKGEEKLWTILNDKLDTLRATNQLPQAIRVAETALEIAKRAFHDTDLPLATSFEKLGQLLDQKGDRAAAKGYLLKAHAILEKVNPPDQRAIYRSARRLAFLCDSRGGKRRLNRAICAHCRFTRNNSDQTILTLPQY